jgi:hypothetical protein
VLQEPEVPQLALNMQALSISRAQAEQEQQVEEGQFTLYMKVAATRGAPRTINLVQQQMNRAWRQNYGNIIQATVDEDSATSIDQALAPAFKAPRDQ